MELEATESIKKPIIAKSNIEDPISKGSQCRKRKLNEECEGDVNVYFATSMNIRSPVSGQRPQNKKHKNREYTYQKKNSKEDKDNKQNKGRSIQLLKKIHLLELENLNLKTQIEKNKHQAKLTKEDLHTQLVKLKNKLKGKHQELSRELDLARANIITAQISSQKTYIELCSSTERKFPWLNRTSFCNIPDDLIRKLTEYLNDDELFAARFLNRIFYGSFYGQRVSYEYSGKWFNFERALKLAKIGRIFGNLEYFELKFWNEDCVQYLDGLHFPSLKYLDIYADGEKVPRNVNIKTVRCARDCRSFWLTHKKFPNIEELIWAMDDYLRDTGWLPQMRIIRFDFCHLNWWKHITKKKYPSLKIVSFHPDALWDSCYVYDDTDDFEEARNWLERDFDAGVVKMQSLGVTVSYSTFD